MPTPQELLESLRQVKYPGFNRDIVSFGMVRDIQIGSRGVTIELATSSANADAMDAIRREIAAVVGDGHRPAGRDRRRDDAARSPGRAGGPPREKPGIPGVGAIVAVASGKGGVGKSTVAANLACALAAKGLRTGLLDADVYGPSVSMMLGIEGAPPVGEDRRIVPAERHGVRAISMGMFLGERTPVIWRGPMVTKLITEFFRNVVWGELDYLILDLPPGTGDAQLTVAQQVPLAGGVIVTTPQDVALLDVRRGITMFEQVQAPVLGVVENMSYHLCTGLRRTAPRSSATAAASAWRGSSACRSSARSRWCARSGPPATRARRSSSPIPTTRRAAPSSRSPAPSMRRSASAPPGIVSH